MSDRLTINHCRSAGFCVAGIREKCAQIDVPFKDFVRNGIPISAVEGVKDHGVQRAIAIARADKKES